MPARDVLERTIAHPVTAQLSIDCGYGSAVLTERPNLDVQDSDRPIRRLLIRGAADDSERVRGGSFDRDYLTDRWDYSSGPLVDFHGVPVMLCVSRAMAKQRIVPT